MSFFSSQFTGDGNNSCGKNELKFAILFINSGVVCVCVCVCVCVSVSVSVCERMFGCIFCSNDIIVSLCVWFLYVYVCMYVSMLYVCMYVCMYGR